MAITFRGIQANGNSWLGTKSSPVVGLKPTAAVSGDLLIAQITAWNASGHTFTVPSGWSLLTEHNFSGTVVHIYYRFAEEAEPSSWIWGHNDVAYPNLVAHTLIAAYSGVNPANPFGSYTTFNGSVSTPWAVAVAGITTDEVNQLLIQAPASGTVSGVSFTVPGSMTSRFNGEIPASGFPWDFGWADEVIAAAGATGTRTWTLASNVSTSYWGLTLSLRPIPAPTITAVSPEISTTDGGTAVTLTGTNFDSASSVTIGGVAATSVALINSTTITCVTPAHAAGAVDVVVTNGTDSDTLTDGITYVSVADNVVKLVKGGSVVGDSKAAAGDWPIDPAWKGYGGPTDLWGTTLTPSEVNAADFGVVLSVVAGTDAVAYVDAVRMKVYYSRPGVAQNTPMLTLLTVDTDRTTVTPRIYQLPRGGHRIAGDSSIDRAVDDAHFYTSRIYSPSRTITKAYRVVEFYLRTTTGTNVPGVQVWASIDGATAVQLRNASGTAFSAKSEGFHRAFFPPGSGSTGRYVRLEFRVPAKANEEVAMDVRVSDVTIRLSHRPIEGRVFTVPLILGAGEHEDRMTIRRTARKQLDDLRDLVDAAAAVTYQTPEGVSGYAHVIGLKAREMAYGAANENAYYAEVTMREVSYGS